MKRHDSDDSPVAAKLQRFGLSGKALYKNQIIIIIVLLSLLLLLFALYHVYNLQQLTDVLCLIFFLIVKFYFIFVSLYTLQLLKGIQPYVKANQVLSTVSTISDVKESILSKLLKETW